MNTGHSKLSKDNQQSAVGLRSEAEKILARAERLSEPDRTLVTMHLQNATSFRQISLITGIGNVTVARRIKKLLAILRDDKLNAVLASGKLLSRCEKRVVHDYYFAGMTLGSIARKYQMSYYAVRKILSFVRKITRQEKYTTTVRNY